MERIKVPTNLSKAEDVILLVGADNKKEILTSLINSGQRHLYYNDTVKQAKKNKILATGEGVGELLKRFNPRESEQAFKQRIEFTKPITPAIYNSLKKPYNKAARNNNIKVKIDVKDERLTKIVEDMREAFYSNHKHSRSQGLDYWLKTEFLDISFMDPNAWVVVEWEQVELTEIAKPQPFVVTSENALNFSFKKNVLEWLFVQKVINYQSVDVKTNKIVLKKGIEYILYTQGKTLTATQACEYYLQQQDNDLETFIDKNKTLYTLREFDTKLDIVPAFRMGYVRDANTDRQTYITPFQPAMCYFDASIKICSEFDLSTMLHAFPQKTELVEKCEGTHMKKCKDGHVLGTNEQCTICKGTGYKTITSAQDVRLIPLPNDWEDVKNIDLSKLTHYDAPPVDLLEFQYKLRESHKLDAHLAMFSSTIFASKDIRAAKTATEVEGDFEGVYDALEPYTEKISEIFKDIMTVIFHIAGANEKQIEEATLIHKFPEDLKLKTINYLLKDLKMANEAGAPSFMVNNITKDISNITNADSPLDRIKYKTQEKFNPFIGKSKEEIILLLASNYISEEDKILYANYGTIFREIEIEHPDFYLMNDSQFMKQWEILKAKIQEFKDRINESKPQLANFADIKVDEINYE